MAFFSLIYKGLKNPKKGFWTLFGNLLARCITNDELYIRLKWKFSAMQYPLNLNNPVTYNEKLNWLKLYDRKPEYTMMVDKYLVKEYVAGKIGAKYIIPTLGVWDNAEDVDFDSLPQQFVLKCNHNSGLGMIICEDKGKLNIPQARKKLKKGLQEDYYIYKREWPYKNVQRRIIAEQYMKDGNAEGLVDYKFFCFNGSVKSLFVATDRCKGEHFVKFDFFDLDFRHLPIINGHPNADVTPEKPKSFEEMKRLASILSENLPACRIDLYEINGEVFFGEITFSHFSAFTPFEPQSWDEIFGSWITLPPKK